jgi:hypothetical protein
MGKGGGGSGGGGASSGTQENILGPSQGYSYSLNDILSTKEVFVLQTSKKITTPSKETHTVWQIHCVKLPTLSLL